MFQEVPRVARAAGRALGATLMVLSVADTVSAQSATGGFVVSAGDSGVRASLSAAQAQAMLPQRGIFTFPAPYGTLGIRVTNASDCNGGDCVDYGYSYWNKINNHAGSDTMLIVVGLNRSRGGNGPTLFTYNKNTGETRNAGPLFDANSSYGYSTAEQWYFSKTRASILYVGNTGPQLLRYDVLSKTFETVFDVTSLLGGGKYLWQMHSSGDDRVHSATVKDANTYQDLGCIVYREDTRQHRFYTPRGDYDECQIDKSGRWLVIKENVDNQYNEDNRVIDIETGAEQVLYDQNGAAGHSDMGYGYIVGEDDKWGGNPYAVRVWQFSSNMNSASGLVVYALPTWDGPGLGHMTHSNSKPGVAISQQMACSSNAGSSSLSRTNEIVCYRLDASMQVLVVAPNMTDLNASGGGSDAYSKRPKGNIDPTGEYFLWTSNMGGNRADVFITRIPAHLLGMTSSSGPVPAPAPSPTPAEPAPSPTPTAPSVTEPVQWTFTVNVSATGTSVTKTGGCDGCPDASAVSSNQISGSGITQFVPAETSTLRYVGLGYGGSGTAPVDINYAIRLQNGVAEVRESNSYRTEIGFAATDTLAIVVESHVVKYLKNGVVFYTSATQAAPGLRLHAVLFNTGGAVNGIGFGGTSSTTTTTTTTTQTSTNPFRRAKPRAIGSTPTR